MVAEPRNIYEAALVETRLNAKYPQMNTRKFKKRVKKARKKEAKATSAKSASPTVAQAVQEKNSSLQRALSDEELKRLMGR